MTTVKKFSRYSLLSWSAEGLSIHPDTGEVDSMDEARLPEETVVKYVRRCHFADGTHEDRSFEVIARYGA